MTKLEAAKKICPNFFMKSKHSDVDFVKTYCPTEFGFEDFDCGVSEERVDLGCNKCCCIKCWDAEVDTKLYPYSIKSRFGMTANQYQLLALRTEKPGIGEDYIEQLSEGLMGLAGEAGEAIDLLKKFKYQGHMLDHREVAMELGDIAWYLAEAASALGYSLSEIFYMNIEKLTRRYPEGFDSERSVNREEHEDA